MSIQVFQNVKEAIRNLDPEDIRKHTERPVRLLLYADNDEEYRAIENYLVPHDISPAKRAQVRRAVDRSSESSVPAGKGDLEIYFDPGGELEGNESGIFGFDPAQPDAIMRDIL